MDTELGALQSDFADLIWEKEPVSSGVLVKMCAEKFGWKKSTTYTVLRKLCDKGLFQNRDGVVTSLLSREAFYAKKSGQLIEKAYHGSLPLFVAAFSSGKPLTAEEIDELQVMLDQFRREK